LYDASRSRSQPVSSSSVGGHDHRDGAGEQLRRQVADTGDVEQRDVDQPDLVVAGQPRRAYRRDGLHQQVQVGEHRALGQAGSARGVHDQRDVPLVDLHLRRIGLGPGEDPLVGLDIVAVAGVADRAQAGDDNPDRTADRFRGEAGQCAQHRVSDKDRRPAVGQQLRDLAGGEPEIHRHGDRAQQVGGQHRLEELGPVSHENRHPVALDDAPRAQPGR
jgi:hypothetical protein